MNYCAVATLSFLGLLQAPPISATKVAQEAEIDTSRCTRWMLDRQTTWIDEPEEEDEDAQAGDIREPSFDMSAIRDGLDPEDIIAGFCGRCGKIADTCYCFWNVGALAVSTQ